MIKKRCAKCGDFKILNDFNKCSSNKDQLNSYCRVCQKEANHERYNQKKNEIVKKIINWQEKNPQKVEKYKKNFYEKSKQNTQ